MSLVDKSIGKKKPTEDDLVGTWYMVANRIRNATVMLCGRDATLTRSLVSYTMIIMKMSDSQLIWVRPPIL